jgi:hypothetical protein
VSADDLWSLLYDEYLPFRLYSDHKQGVSVSQLAGSLGLPTPWIEERIEAARLCIEKQERINLPFCDFDDPLENQSRPM